MKIAFWVSKSGFVHIIINGRLLCNKRLLFAHGKGHVEKPDFERCPCPSCKMAQKAIK